MATTSQRALRLLGLLSTGRRWSLEELTQRLEVSARTVRRDLDALRALDYSVESSTGRGGGYRLRPASRLPPLLIDDDQALAIVVALRTAPTTVLGLGDQSRRALTTLEQVLPTRVRDAARALPVTQLPNYWEFAAPPIAPQALTEVGRAVHQHALLSVERLRTDGSRPEPGAVDFDPPLRVEPHHLVVWAGRWYVVVWDLVAATWRVFRVDRIHVSVLAGLRFEPRTVPGGDVAAFVMTSHERGDVPAQWGCLGSARLPLPAELVARWAPGGSVVEDLGEGATKLTLGAWSWAGIAGLLATFDCDLSDVEPVELVAACRTLVARWQSLAPDPNVP